MILQHSIIESMTKLLFTLTPLLTLICFIQSAYTVDFFDTQNLMIGVLILFLCFDLFILYDGFTVMDGCYDLLVIGIMHLIGRSVMIFTGLYLVPAI